MSAFIKFNKGVMKMPVQWQLWLLLLVCVNLIIPLFFIVRLEARLVAGAFLGSVLLMTILTAVSGITRLLGLGHILWKTIEKERMK